jgi:hypothetical protein
LSKKKEPDKKVTDKKVTVQQPEARYSRSELIAAASSFGVKPEVVAGALKLAGKDTITKAEAEKAIKDFLKRKV